MNDLTKYILLVFGFIFVYTTGNAQSEGTVRGTVVDSEEGTPLEFAAVALFTTDSSLVEGGIATEDGSFSLEAPTGEFYLAIQFVSYEEKTIPDIRINNNNKQIRLGAISLRPRATALEGVTAVAEKSEMVMGLDRKIFNVGKDLSNTGKSASEILDNIPSVTVDIDGNVSMRGSENLQILINGKPSGLVSDGNTDALRALQGNMIERVEVITNPSARYEAEGMGGVINIVLKKDEQHGVNGSFEATAGYPHDYSLGANVNFRRQKLNYFLNYGVSYDERPGGGNSFQQFFLGDTSYITRLYRDRYRTGWSHNLRGGADFYISPKDVLTASVLLGYDDEKNFSDVRYEDYSVSDVLQKITSRNDVEEELERDIEFSLQYDREFDEEDRTFTALIQFNDEGETERSEITEELIDGTDVMDEGILEQRVVNEESERNFLFRSDYVHPFAEDGRLEGGLRAEIRNIQNPYRVEERNDQDEFVNLPEYTNDLTYHENIYAAYAQAGNKFGKFSLQLGLRAELSDILIEQEITDEEDDQFYLDFFPTVHSSYQFDNKHSMQVSYSRRIDRPHFWLLNPFFGYSDSRNIRAGNPELTPEYTNVYEAGYLFKSTDISLYAGTYYRNTRDVIHRINDVDETTGITYVIPINYAQQQSFGLEGNGSVDLYDWWTFSGDINFYRYHTWGTYEEQDLNTRAQSWNTRLNSRISILEDFDFQTIFYYRGKREIAQGYLKPYYMLNIAMSKDVLGGDGTLTLNVRDLLDSREFTFVIDEPKLYSENTRRWRTRSVMLTFIYRLNTDRNARRGGPNNRGMGGDMDF